MQMQQPGVCWLLRSAGLAMCTVGAHDMHASGATPVVAHVLGFICAAAACVAVADAWLVTREWRNTAKLVE
jgi:hypothetical protein